VTAPYPVTVSPALPGRARMIAAYPRGG